MTVLISLDALCGLRRAPRVRVRRGMTKTCQDGIYHELACPDGSDGIRNGKRDICNFLLHVVASLALKVLAALTDWLDWMGFVEAGGDQSVRATREVLGIVPPLKLKLFRFFRLFAVCARRVSCYALGRPQCAY